MAYRLRLESWIREKVYKPIAKVQGFYRPVNGTIATKYTSEKEQRRLAANKEMELVVPKIIWQQQDLTSNQSVMNFIQNLRDKGLVSMTTVLPMLSLDPETEKRNLEKERGTVFDENAPSTGPLPNEGKNLQTDFETGDTIRENKPMESDDFISTPLSRPAPPEGGGEPSTGNNPEDFGMPKNVQTSLDMNKLFERHGKDTSDIKIRKG
jgi:hypothetical protein